MRQAGEEFVFNTPCSLANYKLFKGRFMAAFGFNTYNKNNNNSNGLSQSQNTNNNNNDSNGICSSQSVPAQLNHIQTLTRRDRFNDLSQMELDYNPSDYVSPETQVVMSGEWVSDLLGRAATTNENLENSFHEIQFGGVCINGSEVSSYSKVLGNSSVVNGGASLKVGDAFACEIADGWHKKDKFVFNSNKCTKVTLDAIAMRVPLKRQMVNELIELLFEQMKVIAPINPSSRGYVLGVEALFDAFPVLEIHHRLAPSTSSTSSAAALEPITPKKFFIQKLKDKYAFNRKHDPIISQLKKVFIYFYLFYLFFQKKIEFITNKLKVQDQRKKYTPTKQNLKRLDK
jgi:hypothetical protein